MTFIRSHYFFLLNKPCIFSPLFFSLKLKVEHHQMDLILLCLMPIYQHLFFLSYIIDNFLREQVSLIIHLLYIFKNFHHRFVLNFFHFRLHLLAQPFIKFIILHIDPIVHHFRQFFLNLFVLVIQFKQLLIQYLQTEFHLIVFIFSVAFTNYIFFLRFFFHLL